MHPPFQQQRQTPEVIFDNATIRRALPGQLFYSTQIPVCLWFLAKNINADAKRDFRDRRKEMLFISHTSAPVLDQQPGIIDIWNN